jgi:hypothetical protein
MDRACPPELLAEPSSPHPPNRPSHVTRAAVSQPKKNRKRNPRGHAEVGGAAAARAAGAAVGRRRPSSVHARRPHRTHTATGHGSRRMRRLRRHSCDHPGLMTLPGYPTGIPPQTVRVSCVHPSGQVPGFWVLAACPTLSAGRSQRQGSVGTSWSAFPSPVPPPRAAAALHYCACAACAVVLVLGLRARTDYRPKPKPRHSP